MKTWVISVAVLIAIRLFPVFSSLERVARNDGGVRFNLNVPFRIAEGSIFAILLGTFITPVLVGSWRSEWWQMLLAIIAGVLLTRFAPGWILLNADGITERRALGTRHIHWRDLESVVEDKRRHKVIVTGNDGTEIVHTDMHVSASEFLYELERLKVKVCQA